MEGRDILRMAGNIEFNPVPHWWMWRMYESSILTPAKFPPAFLHRSFSAPNSFQLIMHSSTTVKLSLFAYTAKLEATFNSSIKCPL